MSNLPPCRWRREPTLPGRWGCASPKILTSPRGVTEAQCRQCHCRDHAPPAPPRGRCQHLGPRVGMVYCGQCSALQSRRVELPQHDCARHGLCTLRQPVPGMACCLTCPDYRDMALRPAAGSIRHLTYFVYPFGPAWVYHLDALRQRMSLFNGRRVVAVAVGPETATVAEVASILDDATAEIQPFDNDPHLRECVAFPWLMESVSDCRGPGDVALYGHAKGASSEAWADGVRRWSDSMIRGLLDYWPACRRLLESHPTVGCWKRIQWPMPGVGHPWHYSGSWRWTRCADVYQRDWRRMDRSWIESEINVGRHFAEAEAANIYGEITGREIALYAGSFWEAWAQGQVDQWQAAHAADRQDPVLLTVLLTSARQPELVHEAIASVLAQTCGDWQLLIMDAGELLEAGHFRRYAADARVMAVATGETPEMRSALGMQGWAINEAWRRKLVRGDLVLHLCDDQTLDPETVGRLISRSRLEPEVGAWYGPAEVLDYRPGTAPVQLGRLETLGILGPGNPAVGKVDGLQVCFRRCWRAPWPEEKAAGPLADGIWIDRLAARCPIHPLDGLIGQHRHTPLSTFSRPAGQ